MMVMPFSTRMTRRPTALGARHQAIAAFIGVAGLQPVGEALLHQRVPVFLLYPIVFECLFRVVVVVVGEILDDPPGQGGDVARAHACAGSGQPVQFTKCELVRPKLLGLLVHQLDELLLGAGDALGQHDAGVIAGLHDHAADQVLDPHLRRRAGRTSSSRPCARRAR